MPCWSGWARTLAIAAVPAAAVAATAGVAGLAVSAPPAGVAWFTAALLVAVPSIALGVLVAAREPRNAVAPLLGATGLVLLAVAASDVYGSAAVARPGRLPVSDVLVSLGAGAWTWLYVPVGLLALVFPTGRPQGRGWAAVAVALPAVALAITLLTAVSPEPYPEPFADAPHALGTAEWATAPGYALLPVLLGLLVAAAVSVRGRLRRARGVRRAQLKWFALAGAGLPATLLLCWASYLLLDGPDLVVVGLLGTSLAVPAATAVAVLRHDLFDVDRVVRATVVSALVTAALLAVFTAVSVLGGLALGRGSALVAAVATAGCALVLAPVRRRAQRWVDARFYPVRRAALDAVDALRRRVHAGDAPPEGLAAVLRTALDDPDLQVGHRVPGRAELVDATGRALRPAAEPAVPVRLGGSRIGVLVPGRPGHQPAVLAEVAEAGALLVEVVRLRLEVGGALREVEASRARLLHAGYAERRRLERDLHDGAQQRLVTLGMALRLAQRHLHDGTVDLAELLDGAVAELATSVAELRQLAHGLRPSSLDDGLGPALDHLTATLCGDPRLAAAVAVDVEIDPRLSGLDLPDDVSTTAYFVASEAMTNAVKHAAAGRIGLCVTSRPDGSVLLRVSDDGRGGAVSSPGSGLAGLHDRVAAVGGSLTLRSPVGRGTVLEAVLPCAS